MGTRNKLSSALIQVEVAKKQLEVSKEGVADVFRKEFNNRGFITRKPRKSKTYRPKPYVATVSFWEYRQHKFNYRTGRLSAGFHQEAPRYSSWVSINLLNSDPAGYCNISIKLHIGGREFQKETVYFPFRLVEEVGDLLDMIAGFLARMQKYASKGYRSDKYTFNDFVDQINLIIKNANMRPLFKTLNEAITFLSKK